MKILNLENITLLRRNAASLNQKLAAMTGLGHGEGRFLGIAQGQRPDKQPTAQSPSFARLEDVMMECGGERFLVGWCHIFQG